MSGKYASEQDEAIHMATMDGCCDTIGDVQFGNRYSKLLDFEVEGRDGDDHIVTEDSRGFVTVESFDHIDIDAEGYFTPVERRWAECEAEWAEFYADED